MNSKTWRYWLAGLVALLALAGVVTGVNAAFPAAPPRPPAPPGKAPPAVDDGFDRLPLGYQGMSYSTLAASGKVIPHLGRPGTPPADWRNPFAPLLNIVWGVDHNTTATTSGEP